MPFWSRVRSGLIESIYPMTCAGCGARGTWLCGPCEASTPRLDLGICFRCGAPTQTRCRTCAQLDRSIQFARSAFPYTGWVANAVRRYKYDDEWSRAGHLADLMMPLLDGVGGSDVVVPVPLHADKLRRRGYDQARLLAEEIGRRADIPVRPILVRTRDTTSQVTLTGEERQSNLAGAFTLHASWVPAPGLRFLLVDDVRTTSATLNACAAELVKTAPQAIMAVTLALDLPPRELRDWLDEHRSRPSST